MSLHRLSNFKFPPISVIAVFAATSFLCILLLFTLEYKSQSLIAYLALNHVHILKWAAIGFLIMILTNAFLVLLLTYNHFYSNHFAKQSNHERQQFNECEINEDPIDINQKKTKHVNEDEEVLSEQSALQHELIKLKQVNRELEAFNYTVSHDLRAPLRVMDGMASLLLSKENSRLTETDYNKIAGSIKQNAQQMTQLIDDLLAFSNINKYKPALKTADMNAVMEEALTQLSNQYEPQKVKLNVDKLANTICDPSLIKLVWTNLLSNALKYSSQKEVQEIEIGSRVNCKEIIYFVKDNGAGFDMRHYSKLFGVFQRLHTDADFEGTGIGLAIVERIIKRHNGKVWAESKPDNGAVFYFSLPISPVLSEV